jgi:nucleoid-associated protein YgaU
MSGGIALTTARGGKLPEPAESSKSTPHQQANMQRARLQLYAATPAGAGAKAGTTLGEISFQFNPKEVTVAKTAKWERKTSKGAKTASPPEFSGSEPCKLTLEMFFDATANQDGAVVQAVEELFACCIPTKESAGQKKPSPPLVVLQWGNITSFPAFVTSVSAKYTLFASNGIPIRAVCSVALEEMPGDPLRQNPTSGSLDVRRVHRMVAGDTLASVAWVEYDDPTAWRRLAAYNGIDDPLRVRAGTLLLLPSIEELAAT